MANVAAGETRTRLPLGRRVPRYPQVDTSRLAQGIGVADSVLSVNGSSIILSVFDLFHEILQLGITGARGGVRQLSPRHHGDVGRPLGSARDRVKRAAYATV